MRSGGCALWALATGRKSYSLFKKNGKCNSISKRRCPSGGRRGVPAGTSRETALPCIAQKLTTAPISKPCRSTQVDYCAGIERSRRGRPWRARARSGAAVRRRIIDPKLEILRDSSAAKDISCLRRRRGLALQLPPLLRRSRGVRAARPGWSPLPVSGRGGSAGAKTLPSIPRIRL